MQVPGVNWVTRRPLYPTFAGFFLQAFTGFVVIISHILSYFDTCILQKKTSFLNHHTNISFLATSSNQLLIMGDNPISLPLFVCLLA
jgi:hypothetical protein